MSVCLSVCMCILTRARPHQAKQLQLPFYSADRKPGRAGPRTPPPGPGPPLKRPLPHRPRPATPPGPPRAPPRHAAGRQLVLTLRRHAPGRPIHGPQLPRGGPPAGNAAPSDADGRPTHGGRASADAAGRGLPKLHGLSLRLLPQPRGSVLDGAGREGGKEKERERERERRMGWGGALGRRDHEDLVY